MPDFAHDVRADGLSKDGKTIRLPSREGTMNVRWNLSPAHASYAGEVSQLRAAYRRRGR